MEASKLRKVFIDGLPQELVSKLTKIHHQIIDEGIEKVLDGSINLNGSIPKTDHEIFVALGLHFVTAATSLEGVIKGVREAFPNEPLNININYRDETHEFKFDSLNS
ncbi:hypothetical protein [Rurimicrobium arvi]|uniref:Uncharacterized protein n=1 Tax=Rurimicrobium arvi TaxID=2049916 RepID=A0ABP8MZL8_9BACT